MKRISRDFLALPIPKIRSGILLLSVLCLTGAGIKQGSILFQEAFSYREEGRFLQSQGKLHEALTVYRLALAARPDYAEAYNDLGVLLESLGKTADAQEAYRVALRYDPQLAPAHSNLALLHEEGGRIKEAAEHWAARIRLGPPDDPWVIKSREKLAQYNLPIPLSPEEVVENRQKGIRAAFEAGQTHLRAKRWEEAKAEFRKVLELDPKNRDARELIRKAEAGADWQAEQARRQMQVSRERVERESRLIREREEAKTRSAAGKAAAPSPVHQHAQPAPHAQRLSKKELAKADRRALAIQREMAALERPNGRPVPVQRKPEKQPVTAVPDLPAPAAKPASSAAPDALALEGEVAKQKAQVRQQTFHDLYQRALAAMREGRYEDAAESYQQILTLEPAERAAQQGLGRARKAQEQAQKTAESS